MRAPEVVLPALINVNTISNVILLKSLLTLTVSRARGVDTDVGAVHGFTLIDVIAGFPVWVQLEPIWAETEDLVVAVNALVGTSPIVVLAAIHVSTSVVITVQGGALQSFT